MQVQFTPEQESQLSAMAQQTGVGTEQLVKEAALTLLQEDAKFRAYVEEGIRAADRGKFVEHHEVQLRVQAILNP